MRKSILRFGALALMSMMSISSWAQGGKVIDGSFYDLRNDGNVYEATLITAADAADTWNKDWSTVKFEGKTYKITEVGAKAFAKVTTNKTVMFPTYVKIIGDYAFENMTIKPQANCLSEFDLSNIDLGIGAFKGATFSAGTLIDLGDKPNVVEDLFNGCTGITTILSGEEGLETVGKNAFKNCASLDFFGYKKGGKFYLPITLNKVEESAFSGCTGLDYFEYEGGRDHKRIATVGKEAFLGCKWLTNAVFANVCISFDADFTYAEGSFSGCGLTSVDLSKSEVKVLKTGTQNEKVIGVPKNAFYGNDLTTGNVSGLTLPTNCVEIKEGAFQNNEALTIPTLPSTLLYIEKNAFNVESTYNQGKLYLPRNLKSIGQDAFANRYINNIYAYNKPEEQKDEKGNYVVPTLGTQTGFKYDTMVLPVIRPYKVGDATKTLKDNYSSWDPVNDDAHTYVAEDKEGLIFAGWTIAGDKTPSNSGVDYTLDGQSDFGIYTATITKYTGAATVYGVNKATGKSKYGDYSYDVYYTVNNIPALTDGALTDSRNKLTSIDIKPAEAAEGLSEWNNYVTSYTIEASAFAGYSKLTSVSLGMGITAVPASAFSKCTSLSSVTLDKDITGIGANAFEGTTALTSFPFTHIRTVEASAFADVSGSKAGLKSVSLPATLQSIGDNAFAAESIKDVTVCYENVSTGHGGCKIPTLPASAFIADESGVFKATLKVDDSGTYAASRLEYLQASENNWNKFFANKSTFVEVTAKAAGTVLEQTRVICADENNVFHFSDDVQGVKVTTDIENADVSYTRYFSNTNWKPICLPFNVKVADLKDEGVEVAELYNVRLDQNTGALAAVVWVKLASDATMTAMKPYVVKADAEGTKKFEAKGVDIVKTFDSVNGYATDHSIDCSSTKEKYDLHTMFETRDMFDAKGYYIDVNGNFSYASAAGKATVNPYRFYMQRHDRLAAVGADDVIYKAWPEETSNVKVVVLDDEEEAATYINSLNVRDAENLSAPMYDITGRQIVSPIKGQVYIQNGVKKLAK